MDGLLYANSKEDTLRSKSMPLFTNLFNHFYSFDGIKTIPQVFIQNCTSPSFLAILYMDDGSLCITPRINHRSKTVYLTPHIYLYLQNYAREDLVFLQQHIYQTFYVTFQFAKRKDGFGTILRTTSVKETFSFLNIIKDFSSPCQNMYYKTHWDIRFQQEQEKWRSAYPGYDVISSDSNRFRNYSEEETAKIIDLKNKKWTDKKIADEVNRSYWSVVYKLRELRNAGKI